MFRHFTLVAVALTLVGCGDLVRKLTKGKTDTGDDPGPVVTVPTGAGTAAAPPPTDTATSGAAAGGPTKTAAKAPTNAAASPAELEKAFAALDINDDDQLDGIEVQRCGCAIADANKNGEITKAEYLAAGLLGKFRPSNAPSPSPSPSPAPSPSPSPGPTPTQTQTAAPTAPPTAPPTPPAPAAGGVPPGLYTCSGMVGTVFMTTGRLLIVDGTRYATGADGSGPGTYKFFPDTGMIVFTSGPNADMSQISFARLIAPNRIQMKAGKNGNQNWDCKR